MKTTKKLLAIAALCVAGFTANAQKLIGGNINVGIPSGSFSSGVNTGFGANVDFRMFFTDNIAIGGQIGYETWGAKGGAAGAKLSSIPVLISGDYFLSTEGLMPYAGVLLGYSSNKITVKVPILGDVESSEGGLGFGLRAGALYPLNDKMKLNGSIGYKSYSVTGGNIGQININLGLLLNMGE